MTNDGNANQPTLFEIDREDVSNEDVMLFALGEFQSRGFQLADREFALDRLRGAFKRAAEKFGLQEFSDETIADALGKLGAFIKQVPSFVAKHPYKVTVNKDLAGRAFEYYKRESARAKAEPQQGFAK